MKQEDLWAAFVAKNPSFLTNGASFTAAGLKKFFDQTWEHAHRQGVANGKAVMQNEVDALKKKAKVGGLFGDIFGKGM
jgi:ligand-binding SRPBCC domain-containing protein